ncbi:MAG: biotin-dependent carboxyltransferase family protein [Acidobacteria bacterium]|nr:biotin-dependent carboxyltransferase family protein [Acidobacteriota bacterium]
MSLLIQKSGISTTVQDLGRNGFRSFGINPNGAMDKTAVRLINILLGNNETEPVLEMHFPAPKFLFVESVTIALGGGNFGAEIDGEEIGSWRCVAVKKGNVLSFVQKKIGNRGYLSVKGGFQIENWLGSASTNLKAKIGGLEGRNLQKNDRLYFKLKTNIEFQKPDYRISKSIIPPYRSLPKVRVVAGSELGKLTAESRMNFFEGNFKVRNESDRMGFRLHGENLYLGERLEMLSSAVDFGTIQLLPDGQMVILMADHQTTGGYPRLAHIAEVDLPLVAQLGSNDQVNFELITIAEAEDLIMRREKDLNLLRIACSFKNARKF